MSIEIKPNDVLFIILSEDGEDIEARPHIEFITADRELAKKKLQELQDRAKSQNAWFERCQNCSCASYDDEDEFSEDGVPPCFTNDGDGYCANIEAGYDTDYYYVRRYLYENDRPWVFDSDEEGDF